MSRKRRRPSLLFLSVCLPPVAIAFHAAPSSVSRGISKSSSRQREGAAQERQRIFSLLQHSVKSTGATLASDLTVRKRTNKGSSTTSRRRRKDTGDLPPWLSQYHQFSPSQVKEQIQCLEYTLMEQGFLVADITQVVSAVDRVYAEDQELAAGMVDLLRLLLSLRQDDSGAVFVTTPVLLASILHYADCVAARRRDIPDSLRKALLRQASLSRKVQGTHEGSQRAPQLPGFELMEKSLPVLARDQQQDYFPPSPLGNTQAPLTEAAITTTRAVAASETSPYEPEVRIICKGAARIKRAECLAQVVLQTNGVTQAQASRLRDLYLMCMDQDWRSLALRVVACLYRLEGLLRSQESEFSEKSPQVVQTSREAMCIYAPLAQRLGMHRLKAMIEELAFRLRYTRQYRAVSALYHETGEAMQYVSAYLQSNVLQILQNDEALVGQLKTLQVAARVKEPYSFWRKLLKKKVKGFLKPSPSPNNGLKKEDDHDHRTLSITQVNDIVALRVILTARKMSPDEPDDVTRAREQMLCYYAQHLIRTHWPETDANRLKDYISSPKPNGYRSLHHTSRIASRGIKFPFEVQVRSAEMHAQAEFGVSAHWDYKLSGRDDKSSLKSAAPAMALPPQDLNEAMAALTNEDWDNELFPDPGATPHDPVLADGYLDALVTAKEDMLKNQIYVFIMGDGNEQGELIAVPCNSSIGDAINEIEDIIPSKVQVWKNGRLANKNDKLENGDVMMIAV